MDPFYELYKDAGWIPTEIFINGLITLICLAGICLNLSLGYVTIKTKSLHCPCNILIALYTFFISFLLAGYTIKFFVFLLGINYISLHTCYYIQFIPLVGTYFGSILQLSIGIDRFVGILYPIWYKLRAQFILFKSLIIFAFINALFSIYTTYYGASLHWDKPVMCTMGDPARQPENVDYANIKSLILYCVEFACYALIWFIVFFRKSQISLNNKKLMVSLSIIMPFGLIGYILNLIFFNMIMPLLNMNIFTIEYIVFPISVSIFMIANGSTTPILLISSNEYYQAFRKCFGKTPQQPMKVIYLTSKSNHMNNFYAQN